MKYFYFLLVAIIVSSTCFSQIKSLSNHSAQHSIFLNDSTSSNGEKSWVLHRFDEIKVSGKEISNSNFNTKGWRNAVVPGTVLSSLVANHIYPDPYFGDVNKRSLGIIPDIADVGREFYHYWYRTEFTVPKTFTDKRVWLKMHGINYRSEIWLNGIRLGTMAGMFNAKAFDITKVVNRNGINALAVNVTPVDVPGQSGPKNEKRTGAIGENSNGGDGLIGENVTMLMSAGWDFTFPDGVRDRNTGIWNDVELYSTGDIILEHPFVKTKLNLPDSTLAKITVSVEIKNASDEKKIGVLKGIIQDTEINFHKSISLNPHETKLMEFTPDEWKALVISNPKLWWPINKGNQHLYSLQLAVEINQKTSHEITTRFGVREISSDQNTPDKSRRFLVNGYPIFVRGTNWIPEAMLRNSVKRTQTEMRYTKQAGLNFIRLWGGGIAESDYFFDLCDEMGFLVWNEYWMTGDTKLPTDTALYLENMKSTVERIRNHPSLAYHVSSNESIEINGASTLIKNLDPTRGYQMQSECCGVHDGSPYKYENPMQYFENTASTRGSRIDGFNPEYGAPCLPIVESLREMMPAKDLWPINDSVWNYMDGGGFHQMTTKYRQAVNMFGISNSIEEYAKKAQFVGALNYRAIWEVWNKNKFNYGDRFTSGFLFWYHNSPIKQTSARMYDWSLEPTAALYYSQNGLQPLHAQFDYLKNTVSIYNDFRTAFPNYTVIAQVYDINSNLVWQKEKLVNIPLDGVVEDAIKIDFPPTISQVHFIKLILKNEKGLPVSDSFYWRSNDEYKGAWTMTGPAVSGFEDLNKLSKVNLKMTSELKGNTIKVEVSNPSLALSFFTQLKVLDLANRNIKPSFYSDNFFSLLPGESKTISINFSTDDVPNGDLKLVLDGWNANQQTKTFKIYDK